MAGYEVARALGVDPAAGLADDEAAARLRQYGRNELRAEPPTPAWRLVLAQFDSVLVIVLMAAAGMSVALWAYERASPLPFEAMAIAAVVALHATLGYLQESRAAAAVTALRAMTAPEVTVLRGGRRRRIAAADVVPGDITLIAEGDTIAADGRLIDAAALQTAEGALTGESLPSAKQVAPLEETPAIGDRRNMVFAGTVALSGRGVAIVTATGMEMEIGRIAGLLTDAGDEPTPLQRELDRTGRRLGLIVLVIAVVVMAAIVIVQGVRDVAGAVDVLLLGVALAVAAVPEGLPAVVTAVLAIGVQRMARRHAIVRRLAAVETLGSATVIASDKTGTLTRNEMTVRAIVTASGRVAVEGSGYTPAGRVLGSDGQPPGGALWIELERVLVAADRANNAIVEERDGRWVAQGDPTEAALLVAARKAGINSEALGDRHPRLGEVPFSSERMLMSTLHGDTQRPSAGVVFAKGAPDVLLDRCAFEAVGEGRRPLTPERRTEILKINAALADEAMRTLGVAAREVPEHALTAHTAAPGEHAERDLVFAGLIGMIDPPRPEAGPAGARAKAAGVRPVMITGDHPRTAVVIARELGIASGDRVLTGAEFEALDTQGRAAAVRDVSVYARVSPTHKLQIVDALRQGGAVVAMTGDGVNDAPALKKADIGIAMGLTGTDVSKEAADMVLADDNFATIVTAIEEGRAVFANIRKFLSYLLSSNIGEVLTMLAGVLLGSRLGLVGADGAIVLPLLASQILWINLVTDGPPALALGVDPPHEALMRQQPRPPDEGVLTMGMWRSVLAVGVVMAVSTLLVLDASLPGGWIAGKGDLPYARTMAFTTLMLCQMVNVLNARSDSRSAVDGLFANRWLWASIALSVAMHVAVVQVPWLQAPFGTVALTAGDWLRCAAAASAVLWITEMAKWIRRNRVAGPVSSPAKS